MVLIRVYPGPSAVFPHVISEFRLNGLIRIGTGRDAADAAVATIFGQMQMTGMSVSCVSDDFRPLTAGDLTGRAILHEP